MSKQFLIPFKAKFVLNVKTSMKDFFVNSKEISLREKYNKIKDNLGNIDITNFIKQYCLDFYLYEKYKILHFKYNKAFDVSPLNLTEGEEDYELNFKLQSFEVEVLQIEDTKVTFANVDNEIHSIELNDDLKLIKI